jgi:crossover junction endodeoxyribonuclease RuvC
MIILGIDPGLANTGYGLINYKGDKIELLKYGCIKTLPNTSFAQRLLKISSELDKIIKKYRPEKIAIEQIYFCKNVKTALLVGQARGAVILTAVSSKLPISDFTPLQIKQAITGYGRAEKNQIQQMIKILLKLKNIPKPDDAADALAVAICCAHTSNLPKL